MLVLSIGKKRELMMFLRMLVMTVWVVGIVTILPSCGTSPGYNYTISGTVNGMIGSGLVLQNNGGDDRAITANGAFTFNTALNNGTAYSVTVKTQPTNPSQTCAVLNGSGSMNGSPVSNVVVSCVMNSNPVTVDTLGKYAYVSTINTSAIASYTIGASGALTGITGVTAGTRPNPVTIISIGDPATQYAYVSNMGNETTLGTISVYTIQSDGVLSPGTTVDVGRYPSAVTVDPAGKFAYVANMGSNSISAFKINQTTGALTDGTTANTENAPTSVTIDPLGKFAYAANMGSNSISVYTIDSTTGALSLSTVTPSVAAGTTPVSVTIYADSAKVAKFAYVANMGSGSISVYTIDSTTGALTPGAAVAAGTSPMSVTIDTTGQFAYASNMRSSNISVYTIDSTTGALTAGTAAPTGTTSPNPVKIISIGTPATQYAYVSSVVNSTTPGIIFVYLINSDGSLTNIQMEQPFLTGISLSTVTIDPIGPFAYVTNTSNGVVQAYQIGADGHLIAVP